MTRILLTLCSMTLFISTGIAMSDTGTGSTPGSLNGTDIKSQSSPNSNPSNGTNQNFQPSTTTPGLNSAPGSTNNPGTTNTMPGDNNPSSNTSTPSNSNSY